MEPETVQLKIGGMTCAHCAARVEDALKSLEGVTTASVDLKRETARIEFHPERVRPEDLDAAIRDAGYQPGGPMIGATGSRGFGALKGLLGKRK